jgi:hypothetical protein
MIAENRNDKQQFFKKILCVLMVHRTKEESRGVWKEVTEREEGPACIYSPNSSFFCDLCG